MGVDSGDESENNTQNVAPLNVNQCNSTANRRCCHPKTVWKQFQDYSANTTIHGLKYLGENRSIFEKLWWIFGFVFCVICLIVFIYTIWDKWQKSPVVLALDDAPTPVYKIPFPAITICPEVKSRSNNEQNFSYSNLIGRIDLNPYSQNKPNFTEDELTNFETVAHACDSTKVKSFMRQILGWDRNNTITNHTVYDRFRSLTLGYKDVFVECKYVREKPCEILYSQIYTEVGLCYTFNFVGDLLRSIDPNFTYVVDQHNKLSNYEFDQGYLGPMQRGEFPMRTLRIGKTSGGLNTILYSTKKDQNYNCRSEQGYRISLHSPSEYPQPTQKFLPISHGENVDIKIIPVIVSTSEKLRSYSPQRRQCYFQDERSLRYFSTYNEMNCRLECISNITNSVCGCVQFGVPRAIDIPICGAGSIACYSEVWQQSDNRQLTDKYNEEYKIESTTDKVMTLRDCDCLPECNSVRYEATLQRSAYDMLQDSQDNLINTDFDTTQYQASNINIYFDKIEYLGHTRIELYGISDLVSNFGGLLGLFLGGSILSVVELLYFCTIRSFCKCISYRANRHGSADDTI